MDGIQKKVVVIGPSDAGKTALTLRYVNGSFCESTSSTIGASFLMKRLVMNGNTMTLQIWDTAGQERFKSMGSLYFRSSAAALLVCDLTKSDSLEQLDGWVKELQKVVGSDVVMVVAGNKCDLQERAISVEQGKEFAQKYKAVYFDTSAKTGTGVTEAFQHIAKQLMKTNEVAPTPAEAPNTVNIGQNAQSKGKSQDNCC